MAKIKNRLFIFYITITLVQQFRLHFFQEKSPDDEFLRPKWGICR